MTKIRDIIVAKLQAELQPTFLEVQNESGKHAGHAGAGEETHFRITIQAPTLAELSRVAAHQRIYHILAYEIKTGIHALAIHVK